jgi:hypothetical protein
MAIMKTAMAITLGLSLTALVAKAAENDKKPAPRGVFSREEFIKKYDKNGDGKLDQTEREAARKERQAEWIKKYDKNGDGKLDDHERNAAREEFQRSRQKSGGKGGKEKQAPAQKKEQK